MKRPKSVAVAAPSSSATQSTRASLAQIAAEAHGDTKVGVIVGAVVALIIAAGIGVLIWAVTDGPLEKWFDITFGIAVGASALGSVAKIASVF